MPQLGQGTRVTVARVKNPISGIGFFFTGGGGRQHSKTHFCLEEINFSSPNEG